MLFTLAFWFVEAAATIAPTAQPSPPAAIQADVLIGAGHEGRPQSCARFPQHKCNLGTPGERELTPVVAEEATRILRAHGVSVARVPADFPGHYDVAAAAFIHFDGTEPACGSGASVGYHRAQDKPAADTWHALYARYFPFRFQPDNFTLNLSQYYGFRQVAARDSALVIELGELSCPAQRAWLVPRAKWDGALLAHFLSARIGKGKVPDPGPFRP
ncbi:MAG: hypothetical protein NVS1B14_11890 [Vulcanimicrobiaceae bacterium]